jgi:formylglycine-generating enzyme required for sulfatase activity
MAHIFISYRRKDESFARQLHDLLREWGHSPWLDVLDIPAGAPWDDSIHVGLKASEIVIGILTPESLTSQNVLDEWGYALTNGKRLFLLWLRDVEEADIPPRYIRIQRIDCRTDRSDGLTKLHSALDSPIGGVLTVYKSDSFLNVSRSTLIIAAFLIIAVIGAAIILTKLASSNNLQSTPAPTETSDLIGQAATDAQTNTPQPMSTPTATNTPAPTAMATKQPTLTLTASNTPTETATSIPDPLLQLASTTVAHNADWTPVEHDFDAVTMVLVPVGCFMMGSKYQDDEKPQHEQCFDEPFWIDKTEVTNAQFASFGGLAERSSTRTDNNRPRENITWFEARDYCQKRSARLPTEAEWEYSARGPDSLVYPWGNDFKADDVVYSGNSGNQTADVGSRPAGVSWVGTLDMSGNVWEWVSSVYQPYLYQADDGREDLNRTGVQRVLRGGSWINGDAFALRSAYRVGEFPYLESFFRGFRCARDF